MLNSFVDTANNIGKSKQHITVLTIRTVLSYTICPF